MGYIYILTDPRHHDGHPKHVRYVGLTIRKIDERMVEHIRATENTHRDNWIRQLKSKGLLPNYEIIEAFQDVTKQELGVEERYWIAQFKAWGFKLTNGTSGGDGVFDIHPDVEKRRAKKLSITKKRIFAENPELRAKQAAAAMAWRTNPEIVDRWKAAITSSWSDPEVRKKHLDSLNQPDVLKKISDNAKAIWTNQEFRDRKIKAQTGGNNWKATAVIHISSGTRFDSANCAETWLRDNGYPSASGSAILRACKGQLNVIYGSKWSYADRFTPEFVPKDRFGKNNPSARAVICVDNGMYFECMLDAALWATNGKVNPKNPTCVIWRVCNKVGGAKTAHKYHWRYATDEEKKLKKILDTTTLSI